MKNNYSLKKGDLISGMKWLLLGCVFLFGFFSTALKAQDTTTRRITGTVKDETGSGLPGVAVLIKETTQGTITDVNGAFVMDVSGARTVLVFSYLGYHAEEIVVGNQSVFDVVMTPDITSLEEVVVIGYGTSKKSDLTGAVQSMNAENIAETPNVTAMGAMQGKMAGVDIIRANNKPGGGLEIQIRGVNAVFNFDDDNQTAPQPLFVVDGIFVDNIDDLNPADIEKIDVLKDASATAIYGSRGANGVVIVSTKKGTPGRAKVEYKGFTSISEAMNLPDMMTGEEFIEYAFDAAVGSDRADWTLDRIFGADELENIRTGNYTDWVDLLVDDFGVKTNHSLSFSGGDNGMNYSFGGAYTSDEGIVGDEKYERYNLRASVDKKINDLFDIGFKIYASYSVRDEDSFEAMRNAYRLRPTADPYDENGELQFWPTEREQQISNPLFEADNITRERRTNRTFGNLYLKVSPLEGLSYKMSFSPETEFNRYGEYRGRYSKSSRGQSQRTRAYYNSFNRLQYSFDNIIDYQRNITNEHHVSATLISSIWYKRQDEGISQVRNFEDDRAQFYNTGNGLELREIRSDFIQETLASYAARIQYNYKGKYLLTASGRYDGSSKLAKDNKWHFFPSAAFAWKASEEEVIKDNLSFLSNLKFRISYGETGNNNVSPYSSGARIDNASFAFGQEVVGSSQIGSISNDELTWEIGKEVNFGVDFGIFENRISGSLELYNKKVDGIILNRQIPRISGFEFTRSNIGKIENKGVELGLNLSPIQTPAFTWTATITYSRNRNELLELFGDGKDDIGNRWFIGKPVSVYYDYEVAGIWQESEAIEAEEYGQRPGQVKVVDQNDDGTIDADNDRVVLGSPDPDWHGGITNRFKYKNFDLSVFAYTRKTQMLRSEFHSKFVFDQAIHGPFPARFNGLNADYWTPENPNGEYAMPGFGDFNNLTHYRTDVNFIKVGYITLGYRLPKQLLEKLKMSRLRIYTTVENPFIFTEYEGWDPENAHRNTWGYGFMRRSYQLGLEVTF
ncbi:TonB-dependent receptor [Fulvivirga sp. M361]|uniref:SusC/RagA family TonB-linked outer membrane protein n=1 Tax=Fulvivirga sp. M361 TaxID=2594266 RepID=UPI001179F9BD|nr:TonB-dependent receptor [Fulvivirga sp. M361]TRX60167.1 TonB-dependent receptor [Fulvivirga sp. M361]